MNGPLTPTAFRDWLQTLEPERKFTRLDCENCPLAVYIDGDASTDRFFFINDDGVSCSLPPPSWTWEFMSKVDFPTDEESRFITAKEALAYIEDIIQGIDS